MVLDDLGNLYATGGNNEGTTLKGVICVFIKYNSSGHNKLKRSLNWIGNNTDEPFGMNIDKYRNIYVIDYGITISVYRQMS